jgi:DNA-directed RNA polymerase subunit H (RpoH/RPB5)|tara:strand:- start:1657 stop:2304 length:648 start_codon:yes stop_codon:yes gene_type:complete
MSLSVNSTTVSKIYKSRKIILEILEERGFDVSDHEGFSTNHIHTLFINKQLDMLLENPETKQKIYVKYNLAKNGGFGKLKPQDIQDFIDDAYDVEELLSEGDEFIIVTKDNFNDTIKKLMKTIFDNRNIYFNVYNMHLYLYNLLEHDLVPKHEICTDEEKKEITKKYKIMSDNQFPEISRFDPVAQVIGLRPGQLCRITRSSSTAIQTTYYRLCK